MTHEICLDANFFVACLTDEAEHDTALHLLTLLLEQDYAFFEPALIGFEVTSALRKKILLNQMTAAESQEALETFAKFPLLLQWQTPLLLKALHHANALGFKNAYDMSYLAVAMTKNIPCVTLDREFCKKAKKVYKKVNTVEGFLDQMGGD